MALPLDTSSARRARQFVERHLVSWGVDSRRRELARLLTSELVTNAVRRGRPPLELAVAPEGEWLRIEVSDGTSVLPRLLSTGPEAEGGRGMVLLAALAIRWGAELRDSGKVVWYELSTSADLHLSA